MERFIPVNPEQVEEQHQLLYRFWQLYRELKTFKKQPESYKADAIRKGFRDLVQTPAKCSELRSALGKLAVKEPELLDEAGRQSRDTFASLKKTCRLHGISFWEYLKDRLNGIGFMPRVCSLIKQNAIGIVDDCFTSSF